ncbi:hypothetical protein CPB86DRAFT_786275 [Serendipita vermifera]|nr:hypothetical protein CPB86DRAFT_786275 [Serendipita vermifera]
MVVLAPEFQRYGPHHRVIAFIASHWYALDEMSVNSCHSCNTYHLCRPNCPLFP